MDSVFKVLLILGGVLSLSSCTVVETGYPSYPEYAYYNHSYWSYPGRPYYFGYHPYYDAVRGRPFSFRKPLHRHHF